MSQADVLSWLQAHPGWHDTITIQDAVGLTYTNVQRALAVCASWHEVKARMVGRRKQWSAT